MGRPYGHGAQSQSFGDAVELLTVAVAEALAGLVLDEGRMTGR